MEEGRTRPRLRGNRRRPIQYTFILGVPRSEGEKEVEDPPVPGFDWIHILSTSHERSVTKGREGTLLLHLQLFAGL